MSPPPVTRVRPSGAKARAATPAANVDRPVRPELCAGQCRRSNPVAVSNSRTVPSPPPTASVFPSGENATDPAGTWSFNTSAPASGSISRTSSAHPIAATTRPSGDATSR